MRIFTEENIELVKQSLGEEKIPLYILREIIDAESEFRASPATEIIETLKAVNEALSENPLTIPIFLFTLEGQTMRNISIAYNSLSEANKKIAEGLSKFTEIYPEFIKEREKQKVEILKNAIETMKSIKDEIKRAEYEIKEELRNEGEETRKKIISELDKIEEKINEYNTHFEAIETLAKECFNLNKTQILEAIKSMKNEILNPLAEKLEWIRKYFETDKYSNFSEVLKPYEEEALKSIEYLSKISNHIPEIKEEIEKYKNKIETLKELLYSRIETHEKIYHKK